MSALGQERTSPVTKPMSAETVKCGVQSKGSSTIVTEKNLCQHSKMDLYGTALISTR